MLASTLSLRTPGPATVLSHKCCVPVIPLLLTARPNCSQQSLAGTVSALVVATTSYCHPDRHANVITPCLPTPCLNLQRLFLEEVVSSYRCRIVLPEESLPLQRLNVSRKSLITDTDSLWDKQARKGLESSRLLI